MNGAIHLIRSRHVRCAAFTMVEMTTSMIILAVLLLACGSVVSLATYTVNRATTRTAMQIQVGDAAAQLRDDLNVAMNFTERTSTAATFSVPDRLNAGSPQPVRYAWTGPGAPLTRQFNSGAAVPLLSNVQTLNLNYFTRLVGPAPGPTESLRFQHNTVLLGSAQNYTVDKKNWVSQYFVPTLPNGATSWTLTRVQLRIKGPPNSFYLPVLVVMPDGSDLPNGAVLGQAIIYGSALSGGYEWLDASFTGLTNLNPNQGLCIELQLNVGGGSGGSINLQYESSLVSILSNTCFSTTSNATPPWHAAVLGTNVAMMNVYGTAP
jgi:type II secretory pathway pseudopilin PulG